MSQLVAIEPKTIAEIRNGLCIIALNAETIIKGLKFAKDRNSYEKIIEQVERIDKLLPQVKFEEGTRKFGRQNRTIIVERRKYE